MSKLLFEAVIEKFLHCASVYDNNFQFGFKPGLSTAMCTNVFKRRLQFSITQKEVVIS